MSRDSARKELANLINNMPVDILIAELKDCGAKFKENVDFESKAETYEFNGKAMYSKGRVYIDTDYEFYTFGKNEGQVKRGIFGRKGELVA